MKPEDYLSWPQEITISLHLEPDESSAHPHLTNLKQVLIRSSSRAYIFEITSFLRTSEYLFRACLTFPMGTSYSIVSSSLTWREHKIMMQPH
jgi:hypothetical protein